MKIKLYLRLLLALSALLLCFSCTGCGNSFDKAPATDFSFSYALPDGATVMRGETLAVLPQLTNISENTYRYKSCQHDHPFFAVLFCQNGEEEYRLPPEPYGETTEQCYTVKYEVAAGATKTGRESFKIPEDAPLGAYHLLVYFRNFEQVFENAVTVVRNDDELIEAKKDDFAFSYEVIDPKADYARGETVQIKGMITNQSDRSFFYQGTGAVALKVSLYCPTGGEDFHVMGTPAPTEQERRECEFAPGATDAWVWSFTIPDDAPAGAYNVKVYYRHFEQSFSGALTVKE